MCSCTRPFCFQSDFFSFSAPQLSAAAYVSQPKSNVQIKKFDQTKWYLLKPFIIWESFRHDRNKIMLVSPSLLSISAPYLLTRCCYFKWAIPGLFFLYFCLFKISTVNKKMIYKTLPISGFEQQTSGSQKQLLCQISHNHCPCLSDVHFGIFYDSF